MDPGKVPPELRNLSAVEKMVVQRAAIIGKQCNVMEMYTVDKIYSKRGGMKGLRGHMVAVPQDIYEIQPGKVGKTR